MKINEVTEGLVSNFARSMGAAVASKLGARGTADALLNGIGAGSLPPDSPTFFKDTSKVARTIATLTRAAKSTGGKLSTADIGAILSKRLPTAWRAETNKTQVINAFAAELKKQGVQIGDTPAVVAKNATPDEPIRVGGDIIEPSDPMYASIKAQMANK
jgi:hypothetical protein